MLAVTLLRDYPTLRSARRDPRWWILKQGKYDTSKNSLFEQRCLTFSQELQLSTLIYIFSDSVRSIYKRYTEEKLVNFLRHSVGRLSGTKIINSNIVGINAYILFTSTVNIKFRGAPRSARYPTSSSVKCAKLKPNYNFPAMCQTELKPISNVKFIVDFYKHSSPLL